MMGHTGLRPATYPDGANMAGYAARPDFIYARMPHDVQYFFCL